MIRNPYYYQKRLESLFAELERLVSTSAGEQAVTPGETDALRRQIELLRSRLAGRSRHFPKEKRFRQQALRRMRRAPRTPSWQYRPSTLYPVERIGYVYRDNTLQPLVGEEPPAPPETGITVPLIAAGQPIGQVQVQLPPDHPLSPEHQLVVEAVARQVSLQIQNLRLLEATERARLQAEEATRRYIHENWQAFLDGIRQAQRIGYLYDRSAVKPLTGLTPPEPGIQETIRVMEEAVGTIYVQPPPEQSLSEEDRALIRAVARQIAQQVENLRLLADAAHARAQAEEATRLITRQGWQDYVARRKARTLAFSYDLNQVKPLPESAQLPAASWTLPLIVRGEPIGKLALVGLERTPEVAELASAIAERASTQLETLRLAEELQRHAAEMETVAELSTTISTILDPEILLQTVSDLTKERFGLYHAHIYLYHEAWKTLLLSAGAGQVGRTLVERGHAIPLDTERSLVARAARQRQAVIANDVRLEPAFLPNPLLPETRSEMAIPMIVGGTLLGVFDLQSEQPHRFTEEEAHIFTILATQVGVALQNARLYAEQAATVSQLRELDRLKSSFLANMSHELRTPLNSILGFTDVILEGLDGPLTDVMRNDLLLIQKNGQHLLSLINDILDMAKIEAGRMSLHPETFNLYELLEEVVNITSPLASEKNLALFIDPASDRKIMIFADRTRIRQVMLNLVNNAIKFTERGRIRVLGQRRGDLAVVTVQDTGIGIPPDKLEAIFQEFTQVDTSTTRKVGGTGLGLPISRRLVEMHGGRLWAESRGIPGEGSTFILELPLQARIQDAEKVIR